MTRLSKALITAFAIALMLTSACADQNRSNSPAHANGTKMNNTPNASNLSSARRTIEHMGEKILVSIHSQEPIKAVATCLKNHSEALYAIASKSGLSPKKVKVFPTHPLVTTVLDNDHIRISLNNHNGYFALPLTQGGSVVIFQNENTFKAFDINQNLTGHEHLLSCIHAAGRSQ